MQWWDAREPWPPQGTLCRAVPVVCLVRARGVQRLEREVLVVSIDRLILVLRSGLVGPLGPADELGIPGRFGQRVRLE
jgi:hypothetical protein